MEPDEGLEKIQDALKVCREYKKLFMEKRQGIAVYFKEGPPVEWNFQSDLIFQRFDKFVLQVETINVS